MGYFSNGTEAMIYEDQYCQHCIHHGKCSIWDVHQIYNYDQKNETVKGMLSMLIPRKADGFNGECSMYTEKDEGCVG